MKKHAHYKCTHSLQPGTKCTEVFLAMQTGHAMTWELGTILHLLKTALRVVKGPQGMAVGNKVRDTSTTIHEEFGVLDLSFGQ